jgi:capsular polysaccharide transport system permease protein
VFEIFTAESSGAPVGQFSPMAVKGGLRTSRAQNTRKMIVRRDRTFGHALLRWLGSIFFLMAESFGDRYRRTRLSAFIAIAEPLGIIAIFSLVHSLMTPRPPFGTSDILFFSTGILPFYLFFHISWRLRSWDLLRRLPHTTEFDLLLVQVFDEYLTKIIIIAICGVALWLNGTEEAIPQDPLQCLMALWVIAAMGIAVGFINAVISAFFFVWLYIYAVLIRGWLAFSGVLFVLDWTPPALREIALFNPLAHGIIYYRAGYYHGYPQLSLDIQFMLLTTTGLLFFSIVALLSTRPYRNTR